MSERVVDAGGLVVIKPSASETLPEGAAQSAPEGESQVEPKKEEG